MFACRPANRIAPETMDPLSQITELVAAAIANAESRSALVESRARWSPRVMRAGAGSSVTCTTAHSSGWSPWR